MFKILLSEDLDTTKQNTIPDVLYLVKNRVLRKWRRNGFSVSEGELEINEEFVDIAYYFDLARRGFKMKLVIALKEVENGTEIRCNSIFYPVDKRYIVLAALAAGLVLGLFAGYYVVSLFTYGIWGVIATYAISIGFFWAANYYLIRYFYDLAIRKSAGGDTAKRTANTLVDEVEKAMGELLVPEIGKFLEVPAKEKSSG
ncbi:MAG: hypothetical protein GY771_09560 [bacterium]|nr:hypothetical protein [bacterium]